LRIVGEGNNSATIMPSLKELLKTFPGSYNDEYPFIILDTFEHNRTQKDIKKKMGK
jgi:hypothetical protein